MIYPTVPFPVTLSDPLLRFQGHGVIIDALDVLYAELTRDLFAIAKFLMRHRQRKRLMTSKVLKVIGNIILHEIARTFYHRPESRLHYFIVRQNR